MAVTKLKVFVCWHSVYWNPGWSLSLLLSTRTPDPPISSTQLLRSQECTEVKDFEGGRGLNYQSKVMQSLEFL